LELASLMQLEPAPPAPPPEPQYAGTMPQGREPEAGRPQPRRREASPSRNSGYSNMAQAAIALLLHQPAIARQVETAPLAELEGDDVDLL
ncbi:MAG: hypothetical protein KDI14_10675, partial [Halioglobus sp.]|nr:hypothetical protein [Halioglobus sp.]